MIAYKVLTHDWRPPVQGGPPVCDGKLPHTLPIVEVDTGPDECAAGWNFTRRPETALRIGGLWSDGRPSQLFACEIADQGIERGEKLRRETGVLLREEPISDEILARLHAPMAGDGLPLADLVAEVQAWRGALARPRRDEVAVVAGLRAALVVRGLDWTLQQYPAARYAGDSWDSWDASDSWAASNARSASDSWDASLSCAARDSWAARSASLSWAARDSWAARSASLSWAARYARDARDALTLYVAARRGWYATDPLLLTTGVREAYAAGLNVGIPVAPKTLGWAMEPT